MANQPRKVQVKDFALFSNLVFKFLFSLKWICLIKCLNLFLPFYFPLQWNCRGIFKRGEETVPESVEVHSHEPRLERWHLWEDVWGGCSSHKDELLPSMFKTWPCFGSKPSFRWECPNSSAAREGQLSGTSNPQRWQMGTCSAHSQCSCDQHWRHHRSKWEIIWN